MKERCYKAGLAISIAVVGVGLLLFVKPAKGTALSGSSFNPAHIIDDSTFFNSGTMSPTDIQSFLNSKVPVCDTYGTQPSGRAGYATRADWSIAQGIPPPYTCLKDYSVTFSSVTADAYCGAITGGTKSAANVIYDVSRACGVNPQTLLVLLQKEQTLITDDWPWPIQYRSATGYGCPDTAVCDSQYYGLFNQLYMAARQFKRYTMQPDSYNYAAGRDSYILYNPNSACGGTNITIQNKATAALYNYTPYQPNAAALANLYGTGDSCSAYGNRNFWRLFNDWFGPTSGNGYVLAISDDPNDLRQWVIYGTIKQYVPGADIKRAWNLPESPTVFSASYLNSIPTGPNLDRLFIINGGSTYYFVDNGKRYQLPTLDYFNTWNLNGRVISSVSSDLGLTPTDGGLLTPGFRRTGATTVYMPDGASGSQTVLRPYASLPLYSALEGQATGAITISDDLYTAMNVTIGSTLTTARFSQGGNDYMVIDGVKHALGGSTKLLYPGTSSSVSASTLARLPTATAMTYMLQNINTGTYYVMDGGAKRALSTPALANAWQAPGLPIIQITTDLGNTIPDGSAINTFALDVSGQMYTVDIYKKLVSSTLDMAYRRALSPVSVSAVLAGLIPTDSVPVSRFFQERGTPNVYLLDESGKKDLISGNNTYNILMLWGAYDLGIPLLSQNITSAIPNGSMNVSVYVSDGSTEYVMSKGKKLPVSSSARADWGLASPVTFTDGTLSAFSTGSPLGSMLADNRASYLIKDATEFSTVSSSIAKAWNITPSADSDTRLMSVLIRKYASLTRFVRSNNTSDYTVYLVDKGIWYRLRWEHYINLGGPVNSTMVLAPDGSTTVTDWLSPVIKNENGTYFVVDNGGIRNFPAQMILDQWTGWGSLNVNTLSNDFVNQLPYRGIIERTIKGSRPAVYTVFSGQKRWILYPDTYNRFYAPYLIVSDPLIYALLDGQPI